MSDNSFDARATLDVGDRKLDIFRLDALQAKYDVARLPFCLKILLENLLRTEGNGSVTAEDIEALAPLGREGRAERGDRLHARARGDAGLHRRARRRRPRRDARRDGRPRRRPGEDQPARPGRARHRPLGPGRRTSARATRSPATPSASSSATRSATRSCAGARRRSTTSRSCRRTPASSTRSTSSTSRASCSSTTTSGVAYPDTLVGTDSHTTMINGLGVLGWGVGGIEAEAAMLGQPMSMLIPQVLGFKLTGELPEGATATDLVLTVTELLRKKGVVGKFVEFYGPGVSRAAARRPRDDRQHEPRVRLDVRDLPDRRARRCATSRSPGGPKELIDLVEAYAKEQGLWHDENAEEPTFSDTLELDLGDGRAVARRAEAPAGPRAARRGQGQLPRGARRARRRGRGPGDRRPPRRGGRRDVPRLRPAGQRRARPRGRPERAGARAGGRGRRDARRALGHRGRGDDGRRVVQARPRPRRDRRDHVVHEHLEPVGHARRRPARPQRARAAGCSASRG